MASRTVELQARSCPYRIHVIVAKKGFTRRVMIHAASNRSIDAQEKIVHYLRCVQCAESENEMLLEMPSVPSSAAHGLHIALSTATGGHEYDNIRS